MSEPIKPALTPEEWRAGVVEMPEGLSVVWSAFGVNLKATPDQGVYLAHITAVAPLMAILNATLNGQALGFTQDDVAMLRGIASQIDHTMHFGLSESDDYRELNALADRIEALLPPAT